MRPLLILVALLVFFSANSAPAFAQCDVGICPIIRPQQATHRPVAVPLVDRPVIRAVTAPVRAVVRVRLVQRVIEWRPFEGVRERVQARRAARCR